jgi:hemoglobin
MPKKDIAERRDIKFIVDEFYGKVRENEILGPIFNESAQVDWDKHLPIMYSFWSSILLDEHSYTGNPMPKHIDLSKRTEMAEEQFDEWLYLFHETIDQNYSGPLAEKAKLRASNIARLMLTKMKPFPDYRT